MKAEPLLVAVLLAVGGYFLWIKPKQDEELRRKIEAAHATPSPEVEPAPAPYRPNTTPRRKDEIAVVRGKVVGVYADGLVVDCNQPLPGANFAHFVGVNAGQGDIARIAGLAAEAETKEYGPLLALRGGALFPAEWTPTNSTTGGVFLRAFPSAAVYNGQRLKVLAAPDGIYSGPGGYRMPAYTMFFQIAADPAGSWMWQNQGRTPLDRGAFKDGRK
jgi:hypothetical protein